MPLTTTPIRRAALVLAVAGGLLAPGSSAAAYPWPIKPFRSAHPVRGNFGDPRTVFRHGILNPEGLEGGGEFSFHNGVDIAAPRGTAVYAIDSGVTTQVTTTSVAVRSRGHVFKYVHILPVVLLGQPVDALVSVLGFVMPTAEHVHLTELTKGRLQNPLAPGHLSPYSDGTRPRVSDVYFHGTHNEPVPLRDVRGAVAVVAVASDLPALPVPGDWNGLPVAPAALTWWLTSSSGHAVLPWTVAVDFRDTLPSNAAFWQVYARGPFRTIPASGTSSTTMPPGATSTASRTRCSTRGRCPTGATRCMSARSTLAATAAAARSPSPCATAIRPRARPCTRPTLRAGRRRARRSARPRSGSPRRS